MTQPIIAADFAVVAYKDKNFTPHTVIRYKENSNEIDEIFSLADNVTNGTRMKGRITSFQLSEDRTQCFVTTTWSGVGMALKDLKKLIDLPSKYQQGDKVWLLLPGMSTSLYSQVISVHFYESKVKYDLEVNIMGSERTRIYNIDSPYVLPKE